MTPKLRAWWFHRQGLDGSLADASPAQVLQRSGWSRSVGGIGPYLTLFARARTSRAATDAAVAATDILELPSARGCTYVLPASDYATGLTVGRESAEVPIKQAEKLGVTAKEVDELCQRVLEALKSGPLDPDAIRPKVGDAARSLGEAGRKKGISTMLPLALGRLQATGDIRRIPQDGRLDRQRYRYALWTPGPLAKWRGTRESALQDLARLFFGWVGPATAAEFQWFSALGAKAAREVVATLALVPCERGSDRLLLEEDLAAFTKFKVPSGPQYAVVSGLDAISAARRDVQGLVDDEDRAHIVVEDASRVALGTLRDLPSHALLDRGRVIGLWEYDPAEEAIVWSTFDGTKPKSIRALVDETAAWIRADLGDARSFSLDSPASRAKRIAALRA